MGPCLLIASPQMKDPFFEKAVVLVWHHDEDSAIGVIINRPLEHRLVDVLDLDEIDLSAYAESLVAWGGPVESTSGTVVTRGAVTDDEGWTVNHGLSVTRNEDTLRRLVAEQAEIMLCLGYAGWGTGQLDQEIQDGGWLLTDADPAIVFESPMELRYDEALATLGLTRSMVWMRPIDE